MQGVGNLPPPSAPSLALRKGSVYFSLFLQQQTHKANISLFPHSLSNYCSTLSISLSGRNGFCLNAQNKVKDSAFSGVKLKESENFEDDEFEFDDDDDEENYEFDEDNDDDDEFDDDDELLVPLENMNDWLERKPRGFGEGKVYDTSLEDKLLEEIEQSFKAQVANVEKLKREPIKSKSKVEVQEQEELFNASEGVPGGIRVRINNLPKKKNIHRDLKSAFEGVPGIINIFPVNSGNKKTRDPVCKGLAFVDFKSLTDANRFVQMFSGQIVSFGRSGKPIRCEILKPIHSNYEDLSYGGYNTSEGSFDFLDDEEDEDDDDMEGYDIEDNNFQELVEGPDGKYVLGNSENLSAKDRLERIETLESKLLSKAALYEKEMKLSMIDESEDSKALKVKSEVKNKSVRKQNQKVDKKPKLDKISKPKIPGSSKRLKVREKAKLADVFSRYGTKEAKASK